MQIPLQISFRDMDPSSAVEARIRQRAAGLDHVFDRIMACRVVVERRHQRHHKGGLYHLSIDMTVPGDELVVNRDPSEHHAHEDVYVAIRDAFDDARRQLEDYVRRQSGDVKTHQVPEHGKILRLFPYEGYGFIESSDGSEVYFHRNAVGDGDFDRLEAGMEVRFALHDMEGEKGPQASHVALVGKHHLPPTDRI